MHPLEHVLVAFLILGAPVLDHFETRRLKTSRDPRIKVRSYRRTILGLWIAAAIAVGSAGFGAVATIEKVSWLPHSSGVDAFTAGISAGAILALFAPLVMIRNRPGFREKVAKAFSRLSFFLPYTRTEQLWFFPLCITAGICEEILFRGFLIHYFRSSPFGLSIAAALAASTVVFAIQHLYQGAIGVGQTGVLGAIFGIVFLITGNLILPMILHAAVDVRALLLVRASTSLSSSNP